MAKDLAFSIRKGNNEVFIDIEGNEASVEFKYTGSHTFIDGYISFTKILNPGEENRRFIYGYMSDKGVPTLMPFAYYTSNFSEGLAKVEYRDGGREGKSKYGYVNKNMELVIEPRFTSGYDFSEGLAPVKINNKFGYINKKGEVVIEPIFNWARQFNNGLAIVERGCHDYIINTKGEVISTSNEYEIIHNFFNKDVSAARTNEGWCLINNRGERINDKIFKRIGEFHDGLAPAEDPGKNGYINTKGEWVSRTDFCSVLRKFSDGVVVFDEWIPDPLGRYREVKASGVMDTNFNVIVPPKFKEIGDFHNGYAHAVTFKNWGVHSNIINKKGELIVKE